MTVTVTARCVACGKRREISPGEIDPGDVPMCDACFSPMVAESAQASPLTEEDARG